MITLWGPSSSGKTALLAYLYLRSEATGSGWQVFPTDLSREEGKRQSAKIQKANEFPLATKDTNEQKIAYVFKDPRGELFRLETIDRPGGQSEAMDANLVKSLVESEGIVLLLDYGRGHRETEVIQALDHMYIELSNARQTEGQPDHRPLAVCLSKVDQFIQTASDLAVLKNKPEQFVQDKLTPELIAWIRKFHSNVKFFPVSSVGLRLSYGCVQKSVFYDERLVLRVTNRGTPLNIMEPFIWIFDQVRGAA